MNENWNDSFAAVLKHEGGFVNHPKDPGGMTNLGVTKAVWEIWLARAVTESDMRALTPEKVKPFYKAMYWDKIKGDDLPSGIDYAAYDLAVNSGPGRAAKYLQQIAGVADDGIIGIRSLEAIKKCKPDLVIDAICTMRMNFLKRLPTFDTFGKGWSRRVAEVKDKASGMA
jgi:lysozyme family protein